MFRDRLGSDHKKSFFSWQQIVPCQAERHTYRRIDKSTINYYYHFSVTIIYSGCVPECELDIHLPEGGENVPPSSGYPVIFEVHGGGWDSGVKSATKIPITYWLERNYAFVSVEYRFPSQTPGGSSIWEQFDDVEDALNYMIEIGADQGLDTSRILTTGDSAGGHLACVVSYRADNPAIKGVMNFYGATEWKYYFDTGGKLLGYLPT